MLHLSGVAPGLRVRIDRIFGGFRLWRGYRRLGLCQRISDAQSHFLYVIGWNVSMEVWKYGSMELRTQVSRRDVRVFVRMELLAKRSIRLLYVAICR